MENKDVLATINKELKIYINESSFISNKCRNQVIKIFAEEFQVDLDIDNYKNVDLKIEDDYKIQYRKDQYESKDKINNEKELLERYNRFKERADKLITRKEIDFKNKSTFSNITNLFLILCMFLIAGIVIWFCIHSLLVGDVYNTIWFILVILPMLIPRFKESLENRITQAKNYLKTLLKRIK